MKQYFQFPKPRFFVLSLAVISTCTLVMSSATHAHGIWFAQRSGELALIYGHAAEDLDMIKRADKVKSLQTFNAQGEPLTSQWRKTDHLLLVESANKPAVVATVLDNGYWSKTPDNKWVNKGKDEVPNAIESGRYIKYAVAIQGTLKAPLQPIDTQALQILPANARWPQHIGEPMKVRVLYDGKPAAGAKLTRDYVGDPDAKPLIADKSGIVTFKVRNQGLNVVSVAYDAPPDDPVKATKRGLFASLTFTLAHLPE